MPFDHPLPPTVGSTLARELLEPGERIGAYEVGELITFGMMGGLYRAAIHATGDACTVWVLPALLGRDRDFRKRLHGLAALLPRLAHPNIPACRRMEWDGQRACLELEPCDGRSLERMLLERESGTLLEPAAVARILAGVAAALGAAHALALTHLNLVPASVIVAPGGDARVFGFGLVDALGRECYQNLASAAVPPVRTDELLRPLQSTELRAPEVQVGKPLTRATDVYYLGLLGYFLLTGERISADPAPPSALRPGLHANWNNLLGRCLNPDAALRPLNLNALAEDLAAVEEMDPAAGSIWGGEAAPPRRKRRRRTPPLRQGRGRRMRFAALGAAAGLALAGAAWVLLDLDSAGADGPAPVRVVADAAAANLLLRVEPAGATIRLSGAGEGRFHAVEGPLALRLPPGPYRLHVSAPGHVAAAFSLDADATRQEREFQLEPERGSLQLATTPGAELYEASGATPLFLGKAGLDGMLLLDRRLVPGPHTLLLRAKGHGEMRLQVSVAAGANPLIEAPLAVEGVPVTVHALPEGVAISIDGVEAGLAPLRLESVLPGQDLLLRAHLPGHRPMERVVRVQPGEPLLMDFGTLERETGSLDLRVELAVPGAAGVAARTMVDGVVVDPSEPLILHAGMRTVRVEHPDFEPFEERVTLHDGQTHALRATLRPKPAALRIEAAPAVPLTVLVDGEPVAFGESISLPAGRELVVEVQARDFLTTRQRLRMGPNEQRSWHLALAPIPGPQSGEDWTLPYLDEAFIWIDPGSGQMGSPAGEVENRPNEGPLTRVTLSRGFWAMPYEVRQAFWQQLMEGNPSEYKGGALPVHNVSWDEAVRFCELLTARERAAGRLPPAYVYRLPTEAEWEFAARAGSATPFFFGREASAADGNFRGSYPSNRSAGSVSAAQSYGPVAAGSFAPNPWGLHDMHGNVAEWCANIFNNRLPGGRVSDWPGPADGRDRPVRGGSWTEFAHRARSAARDRLDPGTRSPAVGFRVVLAPDLDPE